MPIAPVMEGIDPGERCAGCRLESRPYSPVSWSPAFAAWLCPGCRKARTEAELLATEAANAAARLQAGASAP